MSAGDLLGGREGEDPGGRAPAQRPRGRHPVSSVEPTQPPGDGQLRRGHHRVEHRQGGTFRRVNPFATVGFIVRAFLIRVHPPGDGQLGRVITGSGRDCHLGHFLSVRKYFGRVFNSPVVERLDKGLIERLNNKGLSGLITRA
eukprot:1193648-Prorocentrum_minimum.AAC.1